MHDEVIKRCTDDQQARVLAVPEPGAADGPGRHCSPPGAVIDRGPPRFRPGHASARGACCKRISILPGIMHVLLIWATGLARGPSCLWLGHARALVPKHLDRRNRAPAICIMRNECRYHHPAQLAHSAPPSAQHKHCNRAERYRPYPPHSSGSSFVPASMLAWL